MMIIFRREVGRLAAYGCKMVNGQITTFVAAAAAVTIIYNTYKNDALNLGASITR